MQSYKIVIILLLFSSNLYAEPNLFVWKDKKTANTISNVLVASQLTLNTIHSLKSNNKGHALKCQALELATTIGVAEVTKLMVHRWRPDHSNNKSFFSEHTAISSVSTGWSFQIGLTIGTGITRMGANKHYLSDVIVGAGVGFAASRICNDS